MGRPKQRFLAVVKVDLKMVGLKKEDAICATKRKNPSF